MIVIKKYLEKINESDQILLYEVDKCLKGEALRSAYIMIWIACAESLKRRFKEAAQLHDSNAEDSWNKIKRAEEEERAVDKIVINQAESYGFIDKIEKKKLEHIYTMRCVYGHPYSNEPTEEEVLCALSEVVESVLSKPVLFRNVYVRNLIRNMIEVKSYIDDDESQIVKFAKDELKRIHPKEVRKLIEIYWKKLEKDALDKQFETQYKRGCIFTQYIITHVESDLFSEDEWHDNIVKYPKTMVGVLYTVSAFKIIGELAQNTHITQMISFLNEYPFICEYMNIMYDFLSSENKLKYEKWLMHAQWDKIKNIRFNIKAIYSRLIQMLKIGDFYIQNDATDYIKRYSNDILHLDNEQQIELGRHIRMAAENSANNPRNLIINLAQESKPEHSIGEYFVEGLWKGGFLNAEQEISIKFSLIEYVLLIYSKLPNETQDEIHNRLIEELQKGRKCYEGELDAFCIFTNIKSKYVDDIISIIRKRCNSEE